MERPAKISRSLYASSSEYASVTLGSVENGPTYSSGSQYVNCILRIHGILCPEFQICQGPECIKSLNML